MEAIGNTPAELTASVVVADDTLHSRDLTLARRAARGDEGAWREIYDRTRQRLFALLAYHTGCREEARELLQETYLSAIRSIPRYNGRGPLAAWLAVIALRRACDWKRRLLRRRRRDLCLVRNCASDPNPAPPSIAHEQMRLRLHAALARLTARQRAALLLHELEGLSYRAVGDALGCSEATARCHGFHARRALQQLFASTPVTPPNREGTGMRALGIAPEADSPGDTTEVTS